MTDAKIIDSKMSIFLVGLPGSGKTTIGKLLAHRLHLPFTDTDEMIVLKYKNSIDSIFSTFGEEKFREMEASLVHDDLHFTGIISTGGGFPCHHGIMDVIKNLGLVIYIQSPLKMIWQRIKDDHNRPLLKGKTQKEIFDSLRELYKKRHECYSQAHFTIKNNRKLEMVLEEMDNRIKDYAQMRNL